MGYFVMLTKGLRRAIAIMRIMWASSKSNLRAPWCVENEAVRERKCFEHETNPLLRIRKAISRIRSASHQPRRIFGKDLHQVVRQKVTNNLRRKDDLSFFGPHKRSEQVHTDEITPFESLPMSVPGSAVCFLSMREVKTRWLEMAHEGSSVKIFNIGIVIQ
mmetsp:Transcript_14728/g.42421  ORF Transcript_14728/g.42421 Transcript_14728/m.42421 type:complete len:161 (+) Transcript_14728:461-943(+)